MIFAQNCEDCTLLWFDVGRLPLIESRAVSVTQHPTIPQQPLRPKLPAQHHKLKNFTIDKQLNNPSITQTILFKMCEDRKFHYPGETCQHTVYIDTTYCQPMAQLSAFMDIKERCGNRRVKVIRMSEGQLCPKCQGTPTRLQKAVAWVKKSKLNAPKSW